MISIEILIVAIVASLSAGGGLAYWLTNRRMDKEAKRRVMLEAEIRKREQKQIDLRKQQDKLAKDKLLELEVIEQLRKALDSGA